MSHFSPWSHPFHYTLYILNISQFWLSVLLNEVLLHWTINNNCPILNFIILSLSCLRTVHYKAMCMITAGGGVSLKAYNYLPGMSMFYMPRIKCIWNWAKVSSYHTAVHTNEDKWGRVFNHHPLTPPPRYSLTSKTLPDDWSISMGPCP